MDNSSFANLAPETRNAIWELVLTRSKSVSLTEPRIAPIDASTKQKDNVTSDNYSNACNASDADAPQSPRDTDILSGRLTALTITCRQIHNECGRLVYFVNTFEIQAPCFVDGDQFESTPRIMKLLTRLPAGIGLANAAALRNVTVNIGATTGEKSRFRRMVILINTLCRQPTAPPWPTKAVFSIRQPDDKIIECSLALDDPQSRLDRMVVEMKKAYRRQRRQATSALPPEPGRLCTLKAMIMLRLSAEWFKKGNGFPYLERDSVIGEWDDLRGK